MNPLKKPYLLYVGNAYPHKNLESLLRAFKIILKKEPDLCLVLVGKTDHFYNKLRKKAKESGLENEVVFANQVSNEELKQLYQNGLAYVFPSLSEGFGLPGLEAMKQRLPVVCSNQGSLPEIYEQAAIYFNPKNIEEMAETILRVITDRNFREELKKAGEDQIKKYSWQKCGQETLRVYKDLLV